MNELNFEDLEFKNQEVSEKKKDIFENDVTVSDIIWNKPTDNSFYTKPY